MNLEFDRKKVINWFLIIIIVCSTISVAIIYAGHGGQDTPLEPQPPVNPTILTFTADRVDANVMQIFPSLLVFAYTEEFDIAKIDSNIYSIEGVRRVDSYYRQRGNTTIEGSWLYVAEIAFAKGYDAARLIEEISDLEQLTVAEAHVVAWVSLPKKITLVNNDLNLMKEHTFSNPLIKAYIGIDTRIDDAILLSLRTDISSEKERVIMAIETFNITASPNPVSLDGEFEVLSLEPRLYVNGGIDYSEAAGFDINRMREEIALLDGITGVDIEKEGPYPIASLELDGNYAGMLADINSALFDINGINDIGLYLDEGSVRILFDPQLDFFQLKTAILGSLADLNVAVKEFHDPRITIKGDVNSATESAEAAAGLLQQFLFGEKFDARIEQYASLSATELMEPDTNSVYSVDENAFAAMLQPVHRVGDRVLVELSFSGVRGRAQEITAREASLRPG